MFKAAYGAGYRAGMAPRAIIHRPDGTKVLAPVNCPYKKPSQFLSRFFWEEGLHKGTMIYLNRWTEGRRV